MDAPSDLLKEVQDRIEQAAQRAGRPPKDITLVAVTKTVPFERVQPLIEAGIRQVGENRVQEALEKYAVEGREWKVKPVFHLIGPLQSNKAKKAAAFFDVIHSLDRWELAEDLNRHAGDLGKILECLIQVKISDEPSKSGLDPALLPEFAARAATLSHLKIRGFMGIPPVAATGEKARPYFQKLRRLSEATFHFPPSTPPILSMGMSSDFEIAIEEGSTMVRIGTALFGVRLPYS